MNPPLVPPRKRSGSFERKTVNFKDEDLVRLKMHKS